MNLRILAFAPLFSGLSALVLTCQLSRLAQAEQSLSSFDRQVDSVLAQMTLPEKVGQMTQAELKALGDSNDVADLFLGSVLSGGDGDPQAGNGVGPWTDVVERCLKQSHSTRLRIPILYGIDAVHGHGNVAGAVVFPHHIGMGCARDAKLVEEIGRITATEVRATGINWGFGPCVAVPRDDRWGRTYEGYSEDPTLCGKLGAAEVRGMQGPTLSADPLRVLACAKHFAGDGGAEAVVRVDTFHDNQTRLALDQGDSTLEEAEFRRLHLAPYPPTIAAGVGSIMPSYSSWQGVKCSGHTQLLTDILKGEMGFQGFLISDYDALDQVTPDYKEAIKISINAGMDMVMVPNKYKEFIKHLTALAESGEVPMSRIDDAVRRILRVKAALGLLAPDAVTAADRGLHAQVGSAEHRAVARQAVRQSLVLLKNEGGALPLDKQSDRIVVVGAAADDLGIQCGGWTIDWQGKPGVNLPGGTTILAGIRQAVAASTKVDFSPTGEGVAGADRAVVVIGETPYAEGKGDSLDLALTESDRKLVQQVAQSGVPTVVVVLSGRPLILEEILADADAIVAAWLPGTEGVGVADVLVGDAPPSGKLSFTWPRTVDQEPINAGDGKTGALFEFGYGLSYER